MLAEVKELREKVGWLGAKVQWLGAEVQWLRGEVGLLQGELGMLESKVGEGLQMSPETTSIIIASDCNLQYYLISPR